MTSIQSSRPDQWQAYAGGFSLAALENAVYGMNQTLDGFTAFDLGRGSVIDGAREASSPVERARWTIDTDLFTAQDTGSMDTDRLAEALTVGNGAQVLLSTVQEAMELAASTLLNKDRVSLARQKALASKDAAPAPNIDTDSVKSEGGCNGCL